MKLKSLPQKLQLRKVPCSEADPDKSLKPKGSKQHRASKLRQGEEFETIPMSESKNAAPTLAGDDFFGFQTLGLFRPGETCRKRNGRGKEES